jgi:hypothetical protein
MDETIVEAIQNWPTPRTVGQVRSFHELDDFYLCFVKDFSTIVCPLNELANKNLYFVWGKAQDNMFSDLKDRLTELEAPLLVLPDLSKSS